MALESEAKPGNGEFPQLEEQNYITIVQHSLIGIDWTKQELE